MSREAVQGIVVPAADGTSLMSGARTLPCGLSVDLRCPPGAGVAVEAQAKLSGTLLELIRPSQHISLHLSHELARPVATHWESTRRWEKRDLCLVPSPPSPPLWMWWYNPPQEEEKPEPLHVPQDGWLPWFEGDAHQR